MDQKPHLVKWATVCSNIKFGGLGVRGLYKLNKALLVKWNRRFANGRNSLWRKTISRKFGERWGGWCLGENRSFLGHACGKKLGRTERVSFVMPSVLWVMTVEFAFGRIFGVGRRLCVGLFPPYLIWLSIKMFW